MTRLAGITLNGVALATVIAVAERIEARREADKEVAAQRFLVARSRGGASRITKNLSRARSGRGRIVWSRQEAFYGS